MPDSPRPSSQPDFWEDRFEQEGHLFGTEPNAFVTDEVHRLSPGSEVMELGAGEGRTLAWLVQEHGHRATAVDFSEAALATARQWADAEDLPLDTIQADVRTWQPDRRWDAAIVTFLQLRPDERSRQYRMLKTVVRPGGWILAEWFRPAYLTDTYDRIGPTRADRMVPVEEARAAFANERIVRCEAVDVYLQEGPHLSGEAAVVRTVVQVEAS